MIPTNNKILVRADLDQKSTFIFNGVEVRSAILFDVNYREKSPVIAQIVSGNDVVSKDEIIICHHNTFYSPSPYHLYEDLFSIPANGKIIFCKLNVHDGSLWPVYENFLCDKVDIETDIPIPEKKQHTDRVVVTNPGYCNYKEGQMVFTRPFAAYQIVYNWQKELRRVHKCYEPQVCGKIVYT